MINGFKYFFIILVVFTFTSCYSIYYLTFEHENKKEIADFYTNGISNDNILQFYEDNKIIYMDLRRIDWQNTLLWGSDIIYLNLFIEIFSKEELDNIVMNSCNLIIGDYMMDFNCDLENNYHIKYVHATDMLSIQNEFILTKAIKRSELKNRIKNINGIHFVTITVDLDYFENGEQKNWINTTRLNLNVERQEYNSDNSWGKG
jgi:hypothetical protein